MNNFNRMAESEIKVCSHPSASFDKVRQAFICSWCGAEKHTWSTNRLREFAKQGSIPELQNIIDCTTH